MEYHRVLLGIAFIVGSIHHCVTIEYDEYKLMEYDWTDPSKTMILGYQPQVFKEDKFVVAECNVVSGTQTECTLTMELPRFSNNWYTCHMVWERRYQEDSLVLPGWLASTGSTIIFPAVYRTKEYDNLEIRTFYMPDCTARDIVSYGIHRESKYLIVPFSDSFDVIYRGLGRGEEEHKDYRKQAFFEDGTPIDNEPIVFFDKIPNSSIYEVRNETTKRLLLLDQIHPMSPNNRSLGYAYVHNIKRDNFSRFLHLDENGMELGVLTDLPRNLPEILFVGQDNILVYSHQYDYVEIINKDLRKIGQHKLSSLLEDSEILGLFVIESDVVVVRCKTETEPPRKWERHCWLERSHQLGSGNSNNIIVELSLVGMTDPHLLIPTYASGRICINALFYCEGNLQRMLTECADEKSLVLP
ncbi:hypothetical protein QAD02_011659 [Eretmocerus hayati]|uniref:Uncharacterized protein n=1 Tax=Eretmocerus hayati TaxID=131215 RepID=A0ACC2NYE1_9HYME|nr:hypothetical protein QAD02_011659 [Eretmocerus hayati]